MLIEFKGICGKNILVNPRYIEVLYPHKIADKLPCVKVTFLSGFEVFLDEEYEDVVKALGPDIE